MKIILLRHVESDKNIKKSFSSEKNQENITDLGRNQASAIAEAIRAYSIKNDLRVEKIYSASSKRAIETSNAIACAMSAKIEPFDSLISVTTDKSLKGKSEEEILKINPTFIKELSLYRAGLFSAYNYSTVADVIKSGKYESEVMNTFNEIISNGLESLKVIVLHHSSITALLINIARSMGCYPSNYYGRVEADLGKIYLVNYDEESKQFSFEIANGSPNELTDL